MCVELLGLCLPVCMFNCMRASVSDLMALLVMCIFPLNIFSQDGSVTEWLACWTQAQKARVQIAVATLSGYSLMQTVHTHCASFHQAEKIGSSPLKGCGDNCRPARN